MPRGFTRGRAPSGSPQIVSFTATLVVLLAVILFSGCTFRVPESELAGVYIAKYKDGIEQLTLKSDGTYIQEITHSGNDKPIVNSGRWRYQLLSNEISARVALTGCLGVGDGFGAIRLDFATNRGGCSFTIERRWFVAGQIRLGPDEASPLWKSQ